MKFLVGVSGLRFWDNARISDNSKDIRMELLLLLVERNSLKGFGASWTGPSWGDFSGSSNSEDPRADPTSWRDYTFK